MRTSDGMDPVDQVPNGPGLECRAAGGPAAPWNARPGIGAVSPTALRLSAPAGASGLLSCDLVVSDAAEIRPGDQLVYYVYPEFVPERIAPVGHLAWYEGGYAATGVAVDLTFSDGRVLANSGVVDHHGFAADAESQGRSKSIGVDQWTRKAVDLTAFAGTRVQGARATMSAHGVADGLVCWLDGPFVEPATRLGETPADLVDTRRGTYSSGDFSRGNTVPATARPHGAVLTIPLTSESSSWPYSYHRDNDAENRTPFLGLGLSHAATPWFGDWGRFHLSPALVDGDVCGRFSHADEVARPHEYRVLLDNGISVLAAPTRHGCTVRFTFPQGAGRVVFDERAAPGEVRLMEHDGDLLVVGRNRHRDPIVAGAPITHYAVRFGRRGVVGSEPGDWTDRVEVVVPDREVTLCVASSLIDLDHALATLDREFVAGGPAAVAAEAKAEWNELLGRVTVEGASPDRLVAFYSCLYRLFLYPNLIGEADGRGGVESANVFDFQPGVPPDATGPVPDDVAINNGFWDTYRTAWPAYALLAPAEAGRLLDGFLAHFRHSGWMPRWAAPGFIDCMVGTSSDVVLADALLKGVPLADPLLAYDSALRNALTPSPESSAGRKGLERSLFLGFVPAAIPEGVSWSLENCINDYGLARLSQLLLDRFGRDHPRAAELAANAAYFLDRSLGYALLFDERTSFFRSRKEDGGFAATEAHFDPRAWGDGYVETNAWGMNFAAPHDGHGLAELFGGREALRLRLDRYFLENEIGDESSWGGYRRGIHEMTEARDIRMGMFALSNQPAHHVPFLYAHTDSPHRMQEIVRECLERLFLGSDFGQGYPGDEDNGEMSAWFVLSAIGLYPLTVGSGEYVLCSPLFPRVELHNGQGGRLVVETTGIAPGNAYIQSVQLNGREWRSVTIDHDRLVAGGHLRIELGASASDWFSGSYPASATTATAFGTSRDLDQVAEVHVTGTFDGIEKLVDDDAATAARLPVGGCVQWQASEQRAVWLYTVTCGPQPSDGPRHWELAALDDGVVARLDVQHAVGWRWPYETRVFAIAAPRPASRYRLSFLDQAEVEVAEVQLLTREERRRG